MSKCVLNGNFINPCKFLNEKLNDLYVKGKGLNFITLSNLKTGEKTREYVFYKINSKDKGLILNFCPWCGEKLHNE